MYVNELSAKMLKDRRKSMRTSAIVHIIIILLAILPFLKTPFPPKEFHQAVLVEFESGSSNEGTQSSAPMEQESAAASNEAAAAEEVVEREVVPETKPIKATPPPSVLTSKTEPPLVVKSKVRKVEVNTPQVPAEKIPQKTEMKDVPAPTKTDKIDLKPTKVQKVKVTVVQPDRPSKTGTGTGSATSNSKDSGSGSGDGKASDGDKGQGGTGSSTTGSGKEDGQGKGDKGTGKSDQGDGADGQGKGDINGDGILTRRMISNPNFDGIIKESGKMTVNVCVDRYGYVSDAEFNPKYSTIRDPEVIRRTVAKSKEFRFEQDVNAPVRECGRLTFVIKIDL